VSHAEITLGRLDAAYEDARVQLNIALTQLSEARDSAGKIGDVAAAFALINAETERRNLDQAILSSA
jgi:hypothetical protein